MPSAGHSVGTRRLGSSECERRRVRKGTLSCWECKRRKSRCTFATPEAGICDGCTRRGVQCVGQEFPDVSVQTGSKQSGDRLGRVEALVEQLVRRGHDHDGFDRSVGSLHGERQRKRIRRGSSAGNGAHPVDREFGNAAPLDSPLIPTHHTANLGRDTKTQESNIKTWTGLPQHVSPPPLFNPPSSNARYSIRYEKIYHELFTAWPTEYELDIVTSTFAEITPCLHEMLCTPLPKPRSPRAHFSQELSELPAPGSNPVLLARKLLILATYIQAIPLTGIQSAASSGVLCNEIMLRAVEKVHDLINCKDELLQTVKGIECIYLESMYYNNAGSLRQAWLAMRRAMLFAQIMGIHRCNSAQQLKSIEDRTFKQPEQMWFRLVHLDRYLSLMLGLPQGSSDDRFATMEALNQCSPEQRLQRVDCVVAGRILSRNEVGINDLAATREIDSLLQNVSKHMPPQWWIILNPDSDTNDEKQEFENKSRLLYQLTHYHLLSRLHLPYLLRNSTNRWYNYSKSTAMNASREILSRYLAIRDSIPIGSYYCGIEFLVFVATAILCVTYINDYRSAQNHTGKVDGMMCFSVVGHQRLVDGGMMERCLQSIDQMARSSSVTNQSRIGVVLRHLLKVEANAANGSKYETHSITNDRESTRCGGRVSESGEELRIFIPSFGTVKIEREPTSSAKMHWIQGRKAIAAPVFDSQVPIFDTNASIKISPDPQPQLEHSVGSLDFLLYPAGPSSAFQDEEGGIGTLQSSIEKLQRRLKGFLEDDRDMQGVDTAFLDSLMRGSDLDVDDVEVDRVA